MFIHILGGAAISWGHFNLLSVTSGFSHQYKEIEFNTNIDFSISRHRNIFSKNDIEPSQGEG